MCVRVSDQEGGRWRSVSRRGPRGGAAVRGAGRFVDEGKDGENGAKFQSVYVCLSVCMSAFGGVGGAQGS